MLIPLKHGNWRRHLFDGRAETAVAVARESLERDPNVNMHTLFEWSPRSGTPAAGLWYIEYALQNVLID